MLVRVKKGLGNYGHVQSGFVQPKNHASGAFEVTAEKGQELIKRGIVEAVEESAAPAPATVEETPQEPEKVSKQTSKKAAAKAADPADDVPTFDAAGGVE